MSEARNMHGNIADEEYQARLAPQSGGTVFNSITDKLSTGLEQIAGFIHEQSQQLSPDNGKLINAGEQTARYLHSSASYLRQADLEQMQSDVTGAIKRNPERSLLIGLGVGVALGLIFRKRR